jgi:hypothetical protein
MVEPAPQNRLVPAIEKRASGTATSRRTTCTKSLRMAINEGFARGWDGAIVGNEQIRHDREGVAARHCCQGARHAPVGKGSARNGADQDRGDRRGFHQAVGLDQLIGAVSSDRIPYFAGEYVAAPTPTSP